MCRNRIDISVVPQSKDVVDKHIEVFESPNRLWLFPLETCRHWFVCDMQTNLCTRMLRLLLDVYCPFCGGSESAG